MLQINGLFVDDRISIQYISQEHTLCTVYAKAKA